MSEQSLIFGCAVTSAESEAQACLLAESVRAYGGRFSSAPIWAFSPRGATKKAFRYSKRTAAVFEMLAVETKQVEIDPVVHGFPFAGKVLASAAAEEQAAGQADALVWLDPDSIIFQEPGALLLEPGKALGCRPVDHVLIGSPMDQPADAFWNTIYRSCGVSSKAIFPMTTSADQIVIRPYINAGMLVVRPGIGLLRGWRDRFRELLAAGIFERFFAQDSLYKIFLHQAILTGVILASLTEVQIQTMSHLVNYPMHMHGQYPLERRPARMNDLISGRYDTFFHDKAWPALFPSEEPLRGWLARQVIAYGLVKG